MKVLFFRSMGVCAFYLLMCFGLKKRFHGSCAIINLLSRCFILVGNQLYMYCIAQQTKCFS